MGSDSLHSYRNELKSALMKDRGQLTMMGWRPLCPICDQPVEFPDMHEAIITRGQARGTDLAELGLLYVRQNVVLVHHGTCHILAAMESGRVKCIRHLLEYEYFHEIIAWLEQVELVSGGIAHDAIRRVEAIYASDDTLT
jgi:hypothetical protein